jgi:hypothetical protein
MCHRSRTRHRTAESTRARDDEPTTDDTRTGEEFDPDRDTPPARTPVVEVVRASIQRVKALVA